MSREADKEVREEENKKDQEWKNRSAQTGPRGEIPGVFCCPFCGRQREEGRKGKKTWRGPGIGVSSLVLSLCAGSGEGKRDPVAGSACGAGYRVTLRTDPVTRLCAG